MLFRILLCMFIKHLTQGLRCAVLYSSVNKASLYSDCIPFRLYASSPRLFFSVL